MVEGEGQGGEWREMWSSMKINIKEKKKQRKASEQRTIADDGN